MNNLIKTAAALALLAASTGARAQLDGKSPEWAAYVAAWKSGIVCTDMPGAAPFIKCSDGIEKAMREAAAQLPPLPKGVTIQASIYGHISGDDRDQYDYMVIVAVDDQTGAHSRSAGYAVPMHCTKFAEKACGRSITYRGYLTWEMDGSVAEGLGKKNP